jgi:putative transposase
MGRVARVCVPDGWHHVTQRGNSGADLFLCPADYRTYLSLLGEYGQRHGLEVLAYCLMTNHIHLVAVPHLAGSLSLAARDTNTAYATYLNKREGRRGHLWQGRFYACVLDESHLWAAIRYVERNPVRAGMVTRAEEYQWSSAAAHCGLRADPLLDQGGLPPRLETDWREWLRDEDTRLSARIRTQTAMGRPCGSPSFVARLRGLTPPLGPSRVVVSVPDVDVSKPRRP